MGENVVAPTQILQQMIALLKPLDDASRYKLWDAAITALGAEHKAQQFHLAVVSGMPIGKLEETLP